jgi:DNA-binding CsgD family transcriptional regulator
VDLVVDHQPPRALVEQIEMGEAAVAVRAVGEHLVGGDRDRADLLDAARVLADRLGGDGRAQRQLPLPLLNRRRVAGHDQRLRALLGDRRQPDDRLAGAARQHHHAGRIGRVDEARAACARSLELVQRLDSFVSWFGAETRILLARALLALGDPIAAREQLAQASRLSRRMSDASVFRSWFDDMWDRFDAGAETGPAGAASLTIAELRVLRFLPSHYSFREIAERLHVTTNTVKTHVHAICRKLDARSRSEAVARATRAGLLGL